VSPRGIVKSKVARLEVPEFTIVADEPAAPVVTVPTSIVAAEPEGPVLPRGSVKSKIAALDVPTFVTTAEPPAALVVTVPTATVAEAPCKPAEPKLTQALPFQT
jgi:hypothetical protein